MKKRVFLLVLLLILFWVNEVMAANKVILFIIDGVNWQEIKKVKAPNLEKLINDRAAVGLMNTKTADDLEPVDTYLTIGSGVRARGGVVGKLSFNFGERWQNSRAQDIYQRRIAKLKDKSAVINISLAQLKSFNQSSPYQAQVGNLGTVLAKKDLSIAVLGNADIYNSYRRQVALLGINKYGIIKQGDIGRQTNQLAIQYPSFYLTNKSYLINKFNDYLPKNDLIIVESGSTSRIETLKYKLTSQKFKEAKREAIKQADSLLGALAAELDLSRDYLIVLAPTPAKAYMKQGYKLSWALVAGPTIEPGLLSSDTTNQLGLITNLDILPTIYSYLVAEPKLKFTGQPITSNAHFTPSNYLNNLNEEIKIIFSWRPIVVKLFIALQIIILTVSGLNLIGKRKFSLKSDLLCGVILMINYLPLFFLFAKFFIKFSLLTTLLCWIGGSLLLVWFSLRCFSKDEAVIYIPNLLIVSTLIIDLWTGGRLLKVSLLGYSPVIGARYYGLGNEYMGLLIGSMFVLLTLFFELKGRVDNKLFFIVVLGLIITIGAPGLGANFGGLLTAVFISLLSYSYLNELNLNLSTFLIISLVGVLIIGGLLAFDLITGAQTHFMRLFLKLEQNGLEELIRVVQRKLAINLRLLEWTIWTKVLLAFVFILVILFNHPQGLIAKIIERYPFFSAGLKALLWGSLVAGILNDSGVVVVATLLLVPVFTLLYLSLREINIGKEGNKC